MGWTNADYEAAVESVLSQEVSVSSVPPRRIALSLALAPSWTPSVLSIGGSLPLRTQQALLLRGCEVTVAVDLVEGLRMMGGGRFDVVVVRPTVQVEGDGVRFVRSFKSGHRSSFQAPAVFVAKQYEKVAFLILPVDGTSEYAVFKNPKIWFLADAIEVPIERAILNAGGIDGPFA